MAATQRYNNPALAANTPTAVISVVPCTIIGVDASKPVRITSKYGTPLFTGLNAESAAGIFVPNDGIIITAQLADTRVTIFGETP